MTEKKSNDPMSGLVRGEMPDDGDDGVVNYADNGSSSPQEGIGTRIVEGVGGTLSGMARSIGSTVAGAFAPVGAGVMTATRAVTSAIGRTFNMSNTASGVTAAVLALALVGSGGVAAASLMDNSALNTVYVGNIDCKKAVDDAKKKYGFGDRDIPEEVAGRRCGYVHDLENSMRWMRSNNSGTEDRHVMMEYIAGEVGDNSTEDGLLYKWNDYYVGAIQPFYYGVTEDVDAQVGDWITFYFEDGDSFEYLVVDTKGDSKGDGFDFRNGTPPDTVVHIPDPQGATGGSEICGYGHVTDSDVKVLEFVTAIEVSEWPGPAGTTDAMKIMGHDGQRICSFTNHGLAPELEEVMKDVYLGQLGMADGNQSKAKKKGLDNAADECRASCPETYDNSSAAMAALSLAYSQDISYDGSSGEGTQIFQEVWAKVIPGDWIMRSCDRCVCTPVRWSGTDDDYPPGSTDTQVAYLESSDKWEDHPYDRSMIDSNGNSKELQPGDIWCESGHTSMYVSGDLIKEFQFQGEADVGPVPAGAFSVSGSIGSYSDMGGIGSRAPGVGLDDGPAGAPRVWRCVNPTGAGSKWADGSIDSPSTAAATGCNEKPKKKRKQGSSDDFSDTLIIGDSIIGASTAKSHLSSMLKGVSVDADPGRSWNGDTAGDSPGALEVAKSKAGDKSRIVFEIGTNADPATGTLSHSQIKQLIDACPDDADIYFVTVYLAGHETHTNETNATIRWAAQNFDNVSVIDWASHAAQHRDLLDGAGIHLASDDAGKMYASLIASALGADGVNFAG